MNKRPLFLTAVFLLLGILYIGEERSVICAGTALILFLWNVGLRIKKRGIPQGVICAVVFLTAFFLGAERMQTEEDYRRQYEPLLVDGEKRVLQGTVWKKETGASAYRYGLKRCYLNGKGSSKPVSCNQILVYLDSGDLSIGDTILVKGTIQTLDSAKNEGNFDEKSFYQSQKIDMKFYGETVTTVSKGHFLIKGLYRKKEQIKEIYQKLLKNKEAGVLSTMVLGDKELLEPETKEIYQKAGISHILAISGLHISILGMGLYGLLQKIGVPVAAKTGISAVIIGVFAILIGAGVSTKRAVLMFFLLLMAKFTGRSYDSLTSLGFAAILILWENPFCYAYSGFLLSFLAVLGVNAGNLVIRCTKRKKEAEDKRQEKEKDRRIHKVKEKLKKQLISGIFIQVFTIPVIAWCYYELPVYVLFVNLFILPTAGILLFLGVFGGVLGCIHIFAGYLPIKMAGILVSGYELICKLFLSLPNAVWVTGKPKVEQMVAFYLVAGIVLLLLCYLPKQFECLSYGILFVSLILSFLPRKNGFEIDVLDVGQGDGIYIESEEGKHYFVDGGSVDVSEAGKYRILPFLKAKGVSGIDCWFVSHCDADHVSGLKEILEMGYQVETLVFSKEVVKDEAFEALRQLAEEKGCKILYLEQGETAADGSICFYACYPGIQDAKGDRNADSLVLLLETEDFTGLLTGDIGKEEETVLWHNVEDRLAEKKHGIDWYKAAHHGSKESNSKELLEKLHPAAATISCSSQNSYGHPGKEAVANMQKAGAKIYKTMECGQITMGCDENGMWVREFLGK